MTNNNTNSFNSLKHRIIQNRRFIFLLVTQLLYSFVVYLNNGAYLDANRYNFTHEVNAHLNDFSNHAYVNLVLIIILGIGWRTQNRYVKGMALPMIFGMNLFLPELWVYQGIFALIIVLVYLPAQKKDGTIAKPEMEETPS